MFWTWFLVGTSMHWSWSIISSSRTKDVQVDCAHVNIMWISDLRTLSSDVYFFRSCRRFQMLDWEASNQIWHQEVPLKFQTVLLKNQTAPLGIPVGPCGSLRTNQTVLHQVLLGLCGSCQALVFFQEPAVVRPDDWPYILVPQITPACFGMMMIFTTHVKEL